MKYISTVTWSGVLAVVLLYPVVESLVVQDVVFVILSQSGTFYYEHQAEQLRNEILAQARALSQKPPVVHLTHEDFQHPGSWTVFPLLPRLNSLHGSSCSWIVLCESYTNFNLSSLLTLLTKYDKNKEIWIGYALYDKEPTIIHHFAFFDNPQLFKYPLIAAGVILSSTLVSRLASRFQDKKMEDTDFSIDPSHELSLFIGDNQQGPTLEHSDHLCIKKESHCATYISSFKPCNKPVEKDSIYFAVKTCSKYHKDRISVVKNTWAKHAMHIGYFSDVEDISVPTIGVNIPNAEHGHCSKTMMILKRLETLPNSLPQVKWIVLVDDDTIISVPRLQQLLSCFSSDKLLAMGERYGYNVQYSRHGYNYITGGGGMVLGIDLVVKLVRSGVCSCPSNTTPDDMYLGMCLARLGIKITHSPFFHQARPVDYAPEYLRSQFPISFHKHWMIDPIRVYQEWFEKAEENSNISDRNYQHTEL